MEPTPPSGPLQVAQGAALARLDLACARAVEVIGPGLAALVTTRIEHVVARAPDGPAPVDERDVDVAALIDQMLYDVRSLDDATVRRAGRHFAPGGLADVVTASYVVEARSRLQVAAARLWGTP